MSLGTSILFPDNETKAAEHVTNHRPLPVSLAPGNKGSTSLFGEVITVERTPLIELSSSYGTSALRDIETTANSGTIAAVNGEIRLRTSTTANGSAILETSIAGRYISGFGAEIGLGAKLSEDPTGNEYANWGGWDTSQNNGFYFGHDATGIYVAKLDNTTETKYRQTAWNLDKLDGTGVSGISLDTTKGTIYNIKFSWYGYGDIVFGIVVTVGGVQQFVPCHLIDPDGLSIRDPNLRVFAEVNNGGDGTSLDLFVAGRQYSIIGPYVPTYRYTGEVNSGVSTSTTRAAILTFRKKSAFLDRRVEVDAVSIEPTTEGVIAEIVLNATLGGTPAYGTPTNYTAAETALEVDTAGTTVTGGEVIWSDYFKAGEANRGSLDRQAIALELPQDQPVTLAVRTVANTGTCLGFMRMREEW